MKSNPNKRTETLKGFIKQDRNSNPADLLPIKEDLICDGEKKNKIDTKENNTNTISDLPNQKIKTSNISKSIDLFSRLIAKEVGKCAEQLEIESEELQAWIDIQIGIPSKTILSLLRTAFTKNLDPLKEEIGFIQYEDDGWQVHISIEGWIKLLNQHTAFHGLTFTESENLIEGVPEWLECSLYTKDRMLPITIREYFLEVKGEQEIWRKMPRRMLRFRALQQCARFVV